MRNVLYGAMRLGKATIFAVGLAVVVAVVLGISSKALAGTGVGAVFNLGQTNSVDALSRLVGSTTGPLLRIDNGNDTGSALQLLVEPKRPPLTVNADAGKAVNLSADELDNKDSSAFFTGATYRNTRSALGVPAPGTNQSYVQCDGPEDSALGGGYSDLAEETNITESSPFVAPEANTDGWEFRWLDNNPTTDAWGMEVVCATFPPMHGSSGS